MVENCVYIGFGMWSAFVISHQIRLLYFLELKSKDRDIENTNFANKIGRFFISLINFIGLIGLASIYGNYADLHNSLAVVGCIAGIAFFFLCTYLIEYEKDGPRDSA